MSHQPSSSTPPRTIFRSDYQPFPWRVETVSLCFELDAQATRVTAELVVERLPDAAPGCPLVLDGGEQVLLELACDGAPLADEVWRRDEHGLTLKGLPERCTLKLVSQINPEANASLEGLYLSSGNFCTQCEAEGFRHITFFPDRPDVLSCYTTTLIADAQRFPVLLSNGNLVEQGALADGRHFARWQDPFPKPSYLFALVAGDLVCREEPYRTGSGRDVLLQVYVEPRNAEKCAHALRSMHKALRWDEERFGLEYDLDRYMIVAVDDFNMGAMENKGLNVFNSKYVLALPETATDDDYLNIESVIGHEYFHNWTGNRITCRDWFQLSLKEGLTVFRDQEFSADLNSAGVKRIEDVRLLKSLQFAEDAGPTAHPVRPESYVEINNFYTMTVYNKGAEVVRLFKTLLGWDGFLSGMDRYVERHDGQAVSTDDFVAAMLDANPQADIDRDQMTRWYSQAGTPLVEVDWHHDAAAATLTLCCRQSCPPTPDQAEKLPLLIPLRVALLDVQGRACPLRLAGEPASLTATERVLALTRAEQTFTFEQIPAGVVPSVLRGFSAPVKLRLPLTSEQKAFLMACDSDAFNRWQAAQDLLLECLLRAVRGEVPPEQAADALLVEAFRRSLLDEQADPSLIALALTLPMESFIADQLDEVDPERIHQAREGLRRQFAVDTREALRATYQRCQDAGPYRLDGAAIGRRRLKNLCLGYLAVLKDEEADPWLWQQARQADNMTDQSAALALLSERSDPEAQKELDAFYQRWQADPLVVDKWLGWQARSKRMDCLDRVQQLMTGPAFSLKNPNKVRALIGAFCQGNPARFHAPDGRGYRFLEQQIAALDAFNPQIAARLVTPLLRWPRYEPRRREQMRAVLERLSRRDKISPDLYEMVNKSLQQVVADEQP
ncbi:MAG: aminopeptidase N [Desulfuromonadaceae bacterium]|nr:aminopeptidase N [Desulfuromonadaceae bacterium]